MILSPVISQDKSAAPGNTDSVTNYITPSSWTSQSPGCFICNHFLFQMLLGLFNGIISSTVPKHCTWSEKNNHFSYFPWHSFGRASVCSSCVPSVWTMNLYSADHLLFLPSLQGGMVVRHMQKLGTGACGESSFLFSWSFLLFIKVRAAAPAFHSWCKSGSFALAIVKYNVWTWMLHQQ